MSRKTNNQIKLVAAIALVLFVGATFAPQINEFIVNITGGANPFEFDPVAGEVAPHKFVLTTRGTVTALAGADVYAWYDWNGNGLVDLGVYPTGEIETLSSAATSGLVTTAVEYPIGQAVLYQVHKAGYEVETFSRIRATIPNAHDGSALSVYGCALTTTDTGATEIRIGGNLLVTESTDYNFTYSGDEPTAEVTHVSDTGDAGITEQAFTHWGTGKAYAGTFLGITMLQADFAKLQPKGFSGAYTDGTNYYVWYFTAGYFNDADVAGDQRFTMAFGMEISAAADLAIIGFYNGVEASDLELGMWNTVLGTEETNIDIVA